MLETSSEKYNWTTSVPVQEPVFFTRKVYNEKNLIFTGGTHMNPKKENYRKLAATIIRNLERRNMEGYYCETSSEAVKLALNMIPKDASVSFGGSMTFEETGMYDALKSSPFRLIDRNLDKTPEEKKQTFRDSVASDYFFMSSNAVTIGGELINIDGNGNRVACLIQGPEHVVLMVGMNKIVPDVDFGIARVRNAAAPANVTRLGLHPPCSVTGHCADCTSPDCICAQIVITRYSRHRGRIKVIFIGEELGY